MTLKMSTTRGAVYTLADDGTVLARSNGPAGWDYSGKWKILGMSTRHNAHHITPIEECVDTIPGQGWVHDLDNGTHRMWGTERAERVWRVREDDDHPEHVDCADGCGLVVSHSGACRRKPGGAEICTEDNHDECSTQRQ